ncbi:YesL family protein [Halalkalibacterium halodurans]|uniref:YesL family protein n=1 Tax=Halalkalibacterium halodurans TaxID=86665 RepID=UPI002AA9FAE7|nr:YesL family protein [Halalkalibacterium halodurans]MDY7223292.1 YesL family protein [Halalkalibacterium halodurans]MDY7242513.1 YesL family protein [Halalkalibacterium halodurans]
MMKGGFSGRFYTICDWIMKLAYLNILWLFFSLVGLILFGFFPATVAMFSVIRDLLLKKEISIFQTFWQTYKHEFGKSNLLGIILCMIGFIFYVDLIFLKQTSSLMQLLYMPLLVFSLIYGLTLLYIFPVYVHYELKVWQVIKNAFFVMVLFPLYTFIMVLACLLAYSIMITFPSLLLFFSGSVFSLIIMTFAHFAFIKNDQRLEMAEKL